jgi:amino acid adenylation domain-containing protein
MTVPPSCTVAASAGSRDSTGFWPEVVSGGVTPIPRWSAAVPAATGTAVLDRGPDDALAAELGALCERTGRSLSGVLLAVHVKVVSVLTGERDVLVGHVLDGQPLPCRMTVPPGPWLALLDRAADTEAELRQHRGSAPALGQVDSVVEVTSGIGPASASGSVDGEGSPSMWLSVYADTGRVTLRYATGAADAEHAERVLGYHLTAIGLLCRHGRHGDPTGHTGSLLSEQERALQLTGLGGPRRELPDRRFHQLFEEQVRKLPDRTAAVQGERRWSYAELNRTANRIAHALISAGVSTEDVVAVVADRDLEWMACVLAVFKAGATYLPIEPHFPPGRIEWMLDRARVRTVLAERRTAPALPADGRATLLVEDLLAGTGPDHDPNIPVGAGQAAYIYFTSGSTGEPKGAVCEHGGLLNHLLAKIEDLGIGDGCVVAQTAPQCFDISLWQLVSALLVGGRTVLVEQAVVLDVERFLDVVDDSRVEVLQIVPSYLELLLTHLESRPRELAHLRCVCATGEALKPGLATRWFAGHPATALVNAYGLTETCDDTNHETLHRAPAGDRIPLGRPVNNVAVYVVDDDLDPVPLGSTGEIVFSGVCVARGYVNDPERTRLAFRADPHRPGARLYRSGDFGRWLPGGKLEFRGRRDAQVKIRGFRIEIGEIEARLLQLTDVRDAAVVVVTPPGREPSLIAFCRASGGNGDGIRRDLARVLPEYMVPTSVRLLDPLPVTANGKVDRAALVGLAAAPVAGPGPGALTPPESRLAAIWSDVLGAPVGRIGRDTDFFDAGGTSLSALRLVVALDRAASLAEIRERPVLADLADLLGTRLWGPLPRPALTS